MIPRVYKLKLEDGDEMVVCITERYHSELFHDYNWRGKAYSLDGRPRGQVAIPVKDWNRLVKDGRITLASNEYE